MGLWSYLGSEQGFGLGTSREPPHHLNPPVSPRVPFSWVSFTR